MNLQDVRQRFASKTLGIVIGSSFVLTAAFVGLVAILSRETSGIEGRVPFYVLAMAIAFLIALWKLDERDRDGLTILIATSGIAIVSGFVFAIAMEGVVHAIREPSDVLSQVIVYFVAAAIVCTGLGIWGLRHWREFTTDNRL